MLVVFSVVRSYEVTCKCEVIWANSSAFSIEYASMHVDLSVYGSATWLLSEYIN